MATRRAKVDFRHLCGICLYKILCGYGVHLLTQLLPNTLGILKVLGAGYVLYLAYKVAKSKPQGLKRE